MDTYHAERHPVGKAVLRSSGAIVRLAMAHNPAQRATRSALSLLVGRVRPVGRRALGQVTGIGYAYGGPRGAHRLTGRRVPDVDLRSGRLYEELRTGRFVLITPGPDETGTGREDRLVVTRWASDRRTTLLVRPDGYVAWAADAADPDAIQAALTEWTGPRNTDAGVRGGGS